MATTTNYGWTTPDDTALVKDGASAIRTLGSSIDTTVFANASAGIPKTIVDAKGDLIAGTASDTVARVAVGTNGQVLLADSTAAAGVAWGTPAAGSLTLLSTTTMTGASLTISSISQSYKNLLVLIDNAYGSSEERECYLRFNSDSGNNYSWGGYTGTGSLSQASATATDVMQYGWSTNSTTAAHKQSAVINIYDYTSTGHKLVSLNSRSKVPNWNSAFGISGLYIGGSAISSITFFQGIGNLTAGTVRIYGVN